MSNNENNEQKEEEEEESIDSIHMERIMDIQAKHKYIFRLCLLGDANVGKTSLLTRFCERSFKENYNNTIGVDFKVITLKYKDIITKIHIWDTAGQERFKSIAVNYFRSTQGFIFVYDITDEDSFKNVEGWMNLAYNNSNSYVFNFLVGNKCDMEENRKIDKKRGEDFAVMKNLIFLETSARDNYNVEKLFEYFTYKLIKHYNKNTGGQSVETNYSLKGNSEEIQTSQKEGKKCDC